MQTNPKKYLIWPNLETKTYDAVPLQETYLQVYSKHDPNATVPVLEKWNSNTTKNHIPLRNFSKDFQQMYKENFFKRVYYDDGKVTALSIHNTIFVAKISTDF